MIEKHPSIPEVHPGALLRERVVPALGKPKSEIAAALGISRQTLYDILDEKQGVTAEMALRLGKLCGNGPDLWLNLQRSHDLWKARQTVDVSAIPTLQAAE